MPANSDHPDEAHAGRAVEGGANLPLIPDHRSEVELIEPDLAELLFLLQEEAAFLLQWGQLQYGDFLGE